ncbi:MAG TPA: magnesium chelatase, partial [Terriglobia bacterium]|nr:magnesium chelatase [Terriglobia bacterium]
MSTEPIVPRIKDTLTRARREAGKIIVGQQDAIDKALVAIFTGNHALIEGVPGIAKTLLVRTLA